LIKNIASFLLKKLYVASLCHRPGEHKCYAGLKYNILFLAWIC
jgi:hypothetical protein